MRRGPRLQEFDQFRLKEVEFIRNVEADQSIQRGVILETFVQRPALLILHDEDHVGPFQHADIHPRQRIGAGACRSYLQVRPLRKDPLSCGTAHAVVAADEQHSTRDGLGHRGRIG